MARFPASEAEAENERIWLIGVGVVVAVAVKVVLGGKMDRFREKDEKREELYVREDEVEERSHDVGRICGLVGEVSESVQEGLVVLKNVDTQLW